MCSKWLDICIPYRVSPDKSGARHHGVTGMLLTVQPRLYFTPHDGSVTTSSYCLVPSPSHPVPQPLPSGNSQFVLCV